MLNYNTLDRFQFLKSPNQNCKLGIFQTVFSQADLVYAGRFEGERTGKRAT